MSPTPKDLKNFADKNRNSPKEIFKRLIDTTITHVSRMVLTDLAICGIR